MIATSPLGEATLATVTVTFNPDISILETQLQALPAMSTKIIVDNASQPEIIAGIVALAQRTRNTHVVRNASNLGLAAAVNIGVARVATLPTRPQFVLLLDQDSEPQTASIETLVDAFVSLGAEGHTVGCVGPLLRDPVTGLTHGFHQCTRWRWKRVYPPTGSDIPVPCMNLNGSGTLVTVALFRQLGGLDESFFIDHVDTEWAFHVLAAGYSLWGIPSAIFDHRMGQASARFWWFGWRLWPSRSPQRHYYLFRNAVTLMRRGYVPRVWKVWACAKLLVVLVLHLLFDHARLQQTTSIIRGVRDGFRLRGGKCSSGAD